MQKAQAAGPGGEVSGQGCTDFPQAAAAAKQPLLFGMAAFKTLPSVSPHCTPERLKQEEENWESFLIISLSPNFTKRNKVTDAPPSQRPPLLLGLHPILKAVLYLLAKKKYQQKLVLLRFFDKGMTHTFHVKGMVRQRKCPQATECAEQLFRPLTWGFQKQWKPAE